MQLHVLLLLHEFIYQATPFIITLVTRNLVEAEKEFNIKYFH